MFDLSGSVPFHEIHSDGSLRLRLGQDALRHLDSAVREGLDSLPGHRSREIGGIILGEMNSDPAAVTFLDVLPIESEYRFGPGFRPSDEDIRAFSQAINDRSGEKTKVIGYFRSSLADSLALRVEDQNLLAAFFATGGCLVILVQVDLDKPSTALICEWDGGEDDVRAVDWLQLHRKAVPVAPRAPLLPGNLERSNGSGPHEAPAVAAQNAGAVQQDSPRISPDAQERPLIPANTAPPGWKHPLLRTVVIGAVALAGLLGLFTFGRRTALQNPPLEPDGLLDFIASSDGPTVDLRWNPEGSAVRNSLRADLLIIEGPDTRNVVLDRAQLNKGHYEVTPSHSDVAFVMTVYVSPNVFVGARQDLRVDALQAQPAASPKEQSPELTASKDAPFVPAGTERKDFPLSTPSPEPPGRPREAPPAPDPPKSSFSPPPANTQPKPVVEDPPQIRPPESAAARPVLPSPSIPSTAPGVAAPAGPAPAPSTTFTAPFPIARVSPTIPESARAIIQRPVSVRVAVHVDPQGRVTSTRPLDNADPVLRLLAPYAAQAAREWRFYAARRDGIPVASDTVVVFQFARNS